MENKPIKIDAIQEKYLRNMMFWNEKAIFFFFTAFTLFLVKVIFNLDEELLKLIQTFKITSALFCLFSTVLFWINTSKFDKHNDSLKNN